MDFSVALTFSEVVDSEEGEVYHYLPAEAGTAAGLMRERIVKYL